MSEPKQLSAIGRILFGLLSTALLAPVAALGDEHAFIRTADSAELEWGPCPEFMPEGCAIAVLQGNPAEPNADVFFRLPAGATAPLHRHASAERMVLVSGEMQVRYEGQEPVVLKTGTYAFGPPRLPHDATCRSATDCVLFIAFEEPVDAVAVED
ncbi:MAG TPA: cupin domain-containing protein [Woeseiaceae bacterium]|nr:cupin domain-containing protein [Woeseiaceae bacterium]